MAEYPLGEVLKQTKWIAGGVDHSMWIGHDMFAQLEHQCYFLKPKIEPLPLWEKAGLVLRVDAFLPETVFDLCCMGGDSMLSCCSVTCSPPVAST